MYISAGGVKCESIWMFLFLLFFGGDWEFACLRYNQNSILESIVNVCRDCVISTDNVL